MAALAGERPVALFQGYDSMTDSGRQTAVTGTNQPTGGQSTSYCSICKTVTELAKSLQIDASLSASYMGLGSVDAKTSFFSSLNVTTYSLSIVVYASKVTGSMTRTNAALKKDIAIPADDDQLADFVSTYGDSYVSSITLGGEYYAVYTFYSESEEEQTKLEADLKASGVVAGVSLSAELSTKMSSFSKTSTTRSAFNQKMTGIENPPAVGPDDIAGFASRFATLTLDSPVVIAITTTGYEELAGFRRHFGPIIRARRYFIDNDGIVGKLAQLKQIDNQTTLIKHIYEFYGNHQDKVLEQNQAAVRADIKAIRDQLDAYSDDPTQSFTEPPLPSLANGSPTLKFEHYADLIGSTFGELFEDVDVAAYLRRRTRITRLYMRTGDWVDHMETTYENEAQTWTAKHGEDRGDSQSALDLTPGQFFVQYSGMRDDGNLNGIVLRSEGGVGGRVQGGRGGGKEFDVQLEPGWFCLGFFGYVRDGGCRSIGVHTAHLLDAQWHALD